MGAAGLALLACTGLDPHTPYAYGLLPGLLLLPAGAAASFGGATVLATEGVPPQRSARRGVLNSAMELGPTVLFAVLTLGSDARSLAATGAALVVLAVALLLRHPNHPTGRPPPPTDASRRPIPRSKTLEKGNADMDRFTGTTVLVTGAGSGLGRAIARAFAAEGASVVAAGRTAATLHETVGLIEAAGGTALAVTADVTDSGQLRDLVRETVTRYGGLDVAVNNAGIFRGSGPVGEVGEEDWDAVMRTNLTGVWLAMKHEIAHMKENGGGVIVNISSNLGAHLRIPGAAAYLTSKAGVSVLTRAAALDHIHQGIRINAVSPGASAAPMSLRPGETEAERTERMKAENPLGRVAEAEEVAAAVLYLASPAAGAVVGTDLVIDSGASA